MAGSPDWSGLGSNVSIESNGELGLNKGDVDMDIDHTDNGKLEPGHLVETGPSTITFERHTSITR